MKLFIGLILACLLLPGLFFIAHSQENKTISFKVVHLPRKTAYSKDKLNEEVAKAKDKEAVRKIIRLKNFPSAQLIIQITKADNKFFWWTLNTTTGYEREDQDIILQSKTARKDELSSRSSDSTIRTIYTTEDFQKIFKDTLALLDDIYIESMIREKEQPADGYKLQYSCKPGEPGKVDIPYSKKKMIISSKLLKTCSGSITTVSLYNKKESDRILSNFYLVFLPVEKKETLLAVGKYFKATYPGKDLMELAEFVSAYSSREFGTPYFPQLVRWLSKNLK